MCVIKKGEKMSEVGAIDAIMTPIYQINVQRSKVNPFAPVDEMADSDSSKVKENPFTSPDEVIQAFNLYDPKNRLKILSLFSTSQQLEIIPLMEKESMVLGMKLYDKDKILNMLFDTSQQDISQVLQGSLPLEKAFQLIPEEFLNNFIMSKDLQKEDFIGGFQNMGTQELMKILETITGMPQKNRPHDELLNTLSGLPIEFLQPSLLASKPEMKATLIAKMTESNNELFNLFPKAQLLMPLDKIGKEKTLKGFNNLEKEMLTDMLKQLPEELLPLLLTLIEPQKLASSLIEKYQSVIIKALSGDT